VSQRNNPCPCGSGRKFKNCCGAPGAEKIRVRPIKKEKPVLVTHATLDDLAAYLPEIRAAYRQGEAMGMSHILVAAVHRMSDYAQKHGLNHGRPMIFAPMAPEAARDRGLISADQVTVPSCPPLYYVLFTTGSRVDTVAVTDGYSGPSPEAFDASCTSCDAYRVELLDAARLDAFREENPSTVERINLLIECTPSIKGVVERYHEVRGDDPVVLLVDPRDPEGRKFAEQADSKEHVCAVIEESRRLGSVPVTIFTADAGIAAARQSSTDSVTSRLNWRLRKLRTGELYARTETVPHELATGRDHRQGSSDASAEPLLGGVPGLRSEGNGRIQAARPDRATHVGSATAALRDRPAWQDRPRVHAGDGAGLGRGRRGTHGTLYRRKGQTDPEAGAPYGCSPNR
jgi:hypothetical protein